MLNTHKIQNNKSYKNSLYFLTKQQLKNFFYPIDNSHQLCKYEYEYTKDLLNCTFITNTKNTFKTIKEKTIPMLYGIRNAGDMFTYGEPTVPFKAYLTEYNKKLSLRFIANTIDDSYMGFFITVSSLEEYTIKLNEVKDWTETFSSMPNILDFEAYWTSKNIDTFDYN